ncbi:hypothetical protein NDU88_002589 [Pleurodeles waltl]|uniref:Uncharacterized protein n=1 Tax=Pleurodeles waltl TaxID=8319 RepID=A0AAV7T305_PLEWA|nr:hypothetical protein NDU88_002589 [Pleurodeles waltl]
MALPIAEACQSEPVADEDRMPCGLMPAEELAPTDQRSFSDGNATAEMPACPFPPPGDRTSCSQYNLRQNPMPSTRLQDYDA